MKISLRHHSRRLFWAFNEFGAASGAVAVRCLRQPQVRKKAFTPPARPAGLRNILTPETSDPI
jgi:hypothetical protein